MENEDYVAGEWHDGAVCVMTLHSTPISFIKDEGSDEEVGGIYDSKWHMLRTNGYFYDKRKNQALARKIKPYQNIEVPDFLGGFDYEKILSIETYT